VLALIRPIITTHKIGGKFTSKWDEPYVFYEVYTNRAYKIADGEGFELGPVNDEFLKCFS